MALEDLTGSNKFITSLVPANPLSSDDRREGDDHIRGIKNVLRNSFPALSGPINFDGYVMKTGDTMTGPLTLSAANLYLASGAGGGPQNILTLSSLAGGSAIQENLAGGATSKTLSFIFPSGVSFTGGPVSVNNATGAAILNINGATAGSKEIVGQSAGVKRWAMRLGGGTPDDFHLFSYADDGTTLTQRFNIQRGSGTAGFGGSVYFANDGGFSIGKVGSYFALSYTTGYAFRWDSASGNFEWATAPSGGVVTTIRAGDSALIHKGAAQKNVAGPWDAISDARIKERIEDYTTGLDAVLKLRPRTFNFRSATKLPAKARHISLIAQEAMQAMPETVTVAPGKVGEIELDDLHSLDIGPVTWALVNAVKTLHERIAQLEAR